MVGNLTVYILDPGEPSFRPTVFLQGLKEWKADMMWGEERSPQDPRLPSSLTGMRPLLGWRLQRWWGQQAKLLSRVQPPCVSRLPGPCLSSSPGGNSQETFLPLGELDWPDRLPHGGRQRAGKGRVMFLACNVGIGHGSPQGFPVDMWSLGQRLCPPSAQKCSFYPLSTYGWGPGGQNK